MQIRLVISGRGYDQAAGVPAALTLAEGASVEDALRAAAESLPSGQAFPDSCLLAVSGTHLGTIRHHAPRPLTEGDELVIIAPVAGG